MGRAAKKTRRNGAGATVTVANPPPRLLRRGCERRKCDRDEQREPADASTLRCREGENGGEESARKTRNVTTRCFFFFLSFSLFLSPSVFLTCSPHAHSLFRSLTHSTSLSLSFPLLIALFLFLFVSRPTDHR